MLAALRGRFDDEMNDEMCRLEGPAGERDVTMTAEEVT